MIYHFTKATKHFLLWSLVFLAIGLTVLRLFLMGVEEYKADLESKILELTNVPVQINKLSASMRGFSPEIIIKEIQVLVVNEENKPTIELDQIRIGIDLMQLAYTRQILQSSWVSLVGAKLSVIRKKDGTISIVGLNASESGQPLWLFEGGRYEVLKSEITWEDELGYRKPLKFNEIDVLVKNDTETQTHELHLLSQLDEYGKNLRLSMSLKGDLFEAKNINGRVYIEGSDLHLAKILTTELPYGLNLVAAEGSFKIWGQWEKSKLITLNGTINAKNSILQKSQSTERQRFEIKNFYTQFNALTRNDSWQFDFKNLKLEMAQQDWPAVNLSFSIKNDLSVIAAAMDKIELQQFSEILKFIEPLDNEDIQLFSKLNISGQVKKLSIYSDTVNDKFAVNGRLENLSTKPTIDFPQLKNFSAQINGSNDSGFIQVYTNNANIFFPSLFRDEFSIGELSGTINWQQLANEWNISSEQILLADQGIETLSKLELSIPKDKGINAAFIDLQSSLKNIDLPQIAKYFPAQKMGKEVLEWLDKAFVSGKINQGSAVIYGTLDEFPYKLNQGVFEASLTLDNGEIQFNPDWPNLTKTHAELLFYQDKLSIDLQHAEIKEVIINQADLTIPSIEKSKLLLVTGQAQGEIDRALDFIQHTPIQIPVANILEVIKPEGSTLVDLDLRIPLDGIDPVIVDGTAHFNNGGVNIIPANLKVTDASGELKFTENDFASNNFIANTLGYPINININSDDITTTIEVDGRADVEQLTKQFTFLQDNLLTKEQVSGTVEYQLKLEIPYEQDIATELAIKTDLAGVTVALPGSLSKSAEQKKLMVLSMLISDEQLIPVNINYNNDFKAAININKQSSKVHSAHLVFGTPDATNLKEQTINIQVQQDNFDAYQWMKLLNQGNQVEKKTDVYINKISIRAKKMLWDNKNYGAFEIAFHRMDQTWHGSLSSSALDGAFVVPLNLTKNDKIKLDMAYINLSELVQIFASDEESMSSQELPLFNILSDELWWNDFNLGKLKLDTERREDNIRFKTVNIESEQHKIELTADWIRWDKAKSITEVNGQMVTDDLGNFLTKLGFNNDIIGTSAIVDYSVDWPGMPYQFSLDKIEAELDVELKGGRLASIEPGFGRILGFIAMEQWVKRLSLDFSDIYKQGLSLNNIRGHFKINNGKAVSKKILVDAVPATINIKGEADIVDRTLDYDVGVIPKSSAAVPIAGSIVGGIAGTITKALASDYKEGYFFGSIYKITGTWDDIQVNSIASEDGIFKKTWMGLTDFSWMKSGAN